jgi:hypothetical protein
MEGVQVLSKQRWGGFPDLVSDLKQAHVIVLCTALALSILRVGASARQLEAPYRPNEPDSGSFDRASWRGMPPAHYCQARKGATE